MGKWDRAPRYTKVALGSSADTQIASGDSITVFGIVVDHRGSATTDGSRFALFEENGSTTEIMRLLVPPGESVTWDVPFLADKGLQVTLDPFYLSCTVFHSNAGA